MQSEHQERRMSSALMVGTMSTKVMISTLLRRNYPAFVNASLC